jgi:hypothetical protein
MGPATWRVWLALSLLVGAAHSRGFPPPVPRGSEAFGSQLPSTANCTEHFELQRLDHFSFAASSMRSTFKQRYYVYDRYWTKGHGPIFFYCGNEADVGLYVNATGLMWENAVS